MYVYIYIYVYQYIHAYIYIYICVCVCALNIHISHFVFSRGYAPFRRAWAGGLEAWEGVLWSHVGVFWGPSWRSGRPFWGVLSRVGDRPTATILQVQFHFFDFCLVFYGKIFDQNMPLLEGPIIP